MFSLKPITQQCNWFFKNVMVKWQISGCATCKGGGRDEAVINRSINQSVDQSINQSLFPMDTLRQYNSSGTTPFFIHKYIQANCAV